MNIIGWTERHNVKGDNTVSRLVVSVNKKYYEVNGHHCPPCKNIYSHHVFSNILVTNLKHIKSKVRQYMLKIR